MRRTVISLVALGALALPTAAEAVAVGYNDDGNRLEAGSDSLARANVTLARFSVTWGRLEPEDDRFRFDYVDEAVAALERAGVRPLISLYGSPPWAGPHSENVSCAPDEAHDADYRQIWRELARRYPRALLAVWNEPNINSYGDLEVERAAELTNLAGQAVWSVDPGRTLIGPGASPGEPGWVGYMAEMYARIDPRVELGAHIYPQGERLMRGFRFFVARMKAIAGERELWITETGVSRSKVSPREQRRFVRRAHRHLEARAEAIVFHRFWSPYERDSGHRWDAGLSALRRDGTPNRLFRAIATLGGDRPPPPPPPDSETPDPPPPGNPTPPDRDIDELPQGCSG